MSYDSAYTVNMMSRFQIILDGWCKKNAFYSIIEFKETLKTNRQVRESRNFKLDPCFPHVICFNIFVQAAYIM